MQSPIGLPTGSWLEKVLLMSLERTQGLKALYPREGGAGAVEVTPSDLARLDPDEFLNDTIIDFYMKCALCPVLALLLGLAHMAHMHGVPHFTVRLVVRALQHDLPYMPSNFAFYIIDDSEDHCWKTLEDKVHMPLAAGVLQGHLGSLAE